MSYDKRYLIWAFGYLILGMSLGIVMAASHDHGQRVTHAHINLVGFLLSFGYGIIHKIWLRKPNLNIAKIQLILHQVAALTMFSGLYFLYGNILPEALVGPILGVASISVFIAALLMLYMVLKETALINSYDT